MSRADLNQLLGLATVNPDFCRLLLASPLEAAQKLGISLTPREQEILSVITAQDLQEFSQQLLAKLEANL